MPRRVHGIWRSGDDRVRSDLFVVDLSQVPQQVEPAIVGRSEVAKTTVQVKKFVAGPRVHGIAEAVSSCVVL